MQDLMWLFHKGRYIFIVIIVLIFVGGIWYVVKMKDKNVVAENDDTVMSETTNSLVEDEQSEENNKEVEFEYPDETNDLEWIVPNASQSLFTDNEKKKLEQEAFEAAELVSEIYKDMDITDDLPYGTNIKGFTFDQRVQVVDILGNSGYCVVTDDYNMQNYETVEDFYKEYINGNEASTTIYIINKDGLLTSLTFLFRDDKIQTFYVGIKRQEGGQPELENTLISDVAEIKLTEKGYFIYMYEIIIEHASIRNAIRIKPISDECRELSKKYLSGLDYQKYNILVTNWDGSNVERILMDGLFDDLYRIDTGENFPTYSDSVDAELFERIMTTYLPVTIEDLRANYVYDENSQSYVHEIIFNSPYPPFGEVVDYTYNTDGTITLYSDGVWVDHNSDFAFTDITVIKPLPDGRFKYLSNSVTEQELELPPVAYKER